MSDFGPDVGQCALCGRDPAAGRAAIHTGDETYWYCHDQDGLGIASCYEQAQARLAAAANHKWSAHPEPGSLGHRQGASTRVRNGGAPHPPTGHTGNQ